MADGHFSNFQGPPPNPPAPPPQPQPVPPPAPVPRKNVIARLAHPFISRPPSSNGAGTPNHYASVTQTPTSVPPLSSVRTGPRNISFEAGIPILALSAHADGDKVVLAGREHLRILKVLDDGEPEELAVLRLPGEQKKHFLQHDVKWGTFGAAKQYIATAGTNGNICLYDVNTGRVERTLREHQRQVHRLDWNPVGEIMLSASHDGTIKLWDIRERRSRTTFACKTEAVRDVQWNKTDALVFAAAFDSGIIQRWDYRNPSIYQKKLNAHNGPVYSLDWHPDGKHIATGGRDRVVKVWDFQADVDPRNKPKHTIWTSTSVGKTLWRPVTSSANRANQTTEIATCALATDYSYRTDNRILVWDLKRPYLPTRMVDGHESTPTGMLWRDEDLLWSCSKDMFFMQHDIPYAVEPVKRLPQNTFAWGPDSELTFAILKRSKNRRNGGSRVTFDTDDDLVRDERRRHSHSGTFKPSKTSMKPDSPLDAPLTIFKPNQVTAKVAIPQLFDKAAFTYLATHYVIDLEGECGGRKYTLPEALELNARYAWKAQQYRTAQSWKMLRLGVEALQREEQKNSATTHGQGHVARRTLGLPGNNAAPSGGATPLAPSSPPAALPQERHQQPVNEPLNLPPADFGNGPSSSAASTDGEDSSPEAGYPRRVHRRSHSKSSEHRQERTRHHRTRVPGSGAFGHENLSGSPAVIGSVQASAIQVENSASDSPDHYLYRQQTDSETGSLPILQRHHSLASDLTSSSYAGTNISTTDDDPSSLPRPSAIAAHVTPRHLSVIAEHPPTPGSQPHHQIRPHHQTHPRHGRTSQLTASISAVSPEPPYHPSTILSHLLPHLTSTGDLVTASTLLLLFADSLSLPSLPSADILETYLTFLSQLELYTVGAAIRKLVQANADAAVDLSCGSCGRAVGGRGGGWCAEGCAICGVLGKGRRWSVCADCGHGGCEGCMREWFLGTDDAGEGLDSDDEDGENGKDKEEEGEDDDDDDERGWCAVAGCGCRCLPRATSAIEGNTTAAGKRAAAGKEKDEDGGWEKVKF